MSIRITVWNEVIDENYMMQVVAGIPDEHREQARGHFEQAAAQIAAIHPEGIHGTLRRVLGDETDFDIRAATLDQPEHGLSQDVLDSTDVLVWWGHLAHELVSDKIVDRIQQRILAGMGLIVLHSGHHSKIFRRMMGTTCSLSWRDVGEKTRLWVVNPTHPIAAGLGDCIELSQEEMYGEWFDIPAPDELVFISWYAGGEVFRSGCCWQRGYGRIFYFSPGHETYRSYEDENIIRVLKNAVRWSQPRLHRADLGCPMVAPREKLNQNY